MMLAVKIIAVWVGLNVAGLLVWSHLTRHADWRSKP